MDFAQILVYILAATLALFLVLSIVLVVVLIKISRQIKEITSTAQRTVNTVEKTVTNLNSITSPVRIANIVFSQIKKAKNRRKK